MPALQQNDQRGARQKVRKLSPELSEFLHMLEALEDQLAPRPYLPGRNS